MQETSNYKLNKWDASDRIMMKDFNDDNQAIEEALTAHDEALAKKAEAEDVAAAQMLVKIGEASLSNASAELTYTLENAENWRSIIVYFDLLGGPNQSRLSADNTSSNDWVELYSVNSNYTAIRAHGQTQILPSIHGGAVAHTFSTALYTATAGQGTNSCSRFSVSFTGTVTLKIYNTSSSNYTEGSSITLYGVK